MKKFIFAGIIFLILTGFTIYKLYGHKEEGITATGTIEVTRVDVAPKVSGYLNNLQFDAGDKVESGAEMGIISRPDLETQLLRDEAAVEKAVAQLVDLKKGSRNEERADALAAVSSAESLYEKAKKDYERYQTLFKEGVISSQSLDNAKSALDVTANSLTSVRQRLNLLNEGTRPDVIAAQQKEVERNEAILKISRTMIDDTILVSPIKGVILSKNYEQGELAQVGAAVYTIADLNDCYVKIYIPSTQLGLIKIGQHTAIKIDSYPNRTFTGKIKEISETAEFTPRQSITQRERANMVFAVKVQIKNPEGILKPGMPADVVLK